MQLICRRDVKDYATWKKSFDDDAEGIRDAGLTVLQLWRDAEDAARVFILFDVNDHDKARAFLDAPATKLHADRSGVTTATNHFVKTA